MFLKTLEAGLLWLSSYFRLDGDLSSFQHLMNLSIQYSSLLERFPQIFVEWNRHWLELLYYWEKHFTKLPWFGEMLLNLSNTFAVTFSEQWQIVGGRKSHLECLRNCQPTISLHNHHFYVSLYFYPPILPSMYSLDYHPSITDVIYPFIHLIPPIHSSLSIHSFIHSSIHPLTHPSTLPFTHPSTHLSNFYLFIYLCSIHPPIFSIIYV